MRFARVEEQLMSRAAKLLEYMSERDAARRLIEDGVPKQDAFLAIKAGKQLYRDRKRVFERGREKRLSGYKGNPDGRDIYPGKIDHGYDQPLGGGTDVMRRLQNQLLKEQGRPQRPNNPRLAASSVLDLLNKHARTVQALRVKADDWDADHHFGNYLLALGHHIRDVGEGRTEGLKKALEDFWSRRGFLETAQQHGGRKMRDEAATLFKVVGSRTRLRLAGKAQRGAANTVALPGKGNVPLPPGVSVDWDDDTQRWTVRLDGKLLRHINDADEMFYYLTRSIAKVGAVRKRADDYDEAVEFLNSNMLPFKKGRGWWLPAHNFGVNMTLMGGINIWAYSVLPLFWTRQGYLPAGDDPTVEPEGIVLRPMWQPHPTYKNNYPPTLKVVETLLRVAKSAPMVGETTQREFKALESQFGISIPSNIKAKYVQQAPKLAARRWSVDRVKMKSTFVPLDGRKPVPMPSWGRPMVKAACRVASLYMTRRQRGM